VATTQGIADRPSRFPRQAVSFFASLLLALSLLSSACDPLPGVGSLGGDSPPPSGSLSVSFIDVGQGDGVLVQAGGEEYLIDAGRPEEGPNVVDFLRSRGVEDLDGIVVYKSPLFVERWG
jgi:competence protein ComEC